MYFFIIIVQGIEHIMLCYKLKSLFPKPYKSTFGENLVFNIIVQNYTIELVTEWNLDPDNSRKYIFVLI